MKNSELRGLSVDELKGRLLSEQDSYKKLRFAHSITPIENPMKIRASRRIIAKIQTEISKKELSK